MSHKKMTCGGGRVHGCFEHISTGGAAQSARAFCLRKTIKDCLQNKKITHPYARKGALHTFTPSHLHTFTSSRAAEQLQELQKENIQLQDKQKNLDKRMDELRKQPVVKPDVSEELAEQVAQLEMLKRHRKRQEQRLKKQLEKVTEENRKLSSDNDRDAKKLAADKQKYVEGKNKLEKRYAELQEENGRLRSTLAQIPPRSIHFARNKRTSSAPYNVIIKNDRVYRLGYKAFESSREVTVRREGNMLLLTPVQGVSIRSLMMERGEDVLPGFNRNRHFAWLIVAPDSFEAFVSFRRFMRKLNFDVYWYTADKMVLYLVENASYSAAN